MPKQVTTVDALFKELLKLEPKLAKKVLRQALRPAAKPMLKTAKANAPKGKTGNLKRFIRLRAAKRSRRSIGVNIIPGTRAQLGIPPNAKGYYPAAQEYGFRKRGGKGFVPAKLFMLRAFQTNRKNAERIAAREIRAGLTRELR